MIRRYMLWFVLAVFTLGLLATFLLTPVHAAGPAPDEVFTLPLGTNTQASTIRLEDGNGQVFVVGRAESGAYKSSVIVQRMSDGACVLCGIPEAYGTPFAQYEGGYALLSALDTNKRTFRTWRLDERYGFAKRPSLARAAVLPMVAR